MSPTSWLSLLNILTEADEYYPHQNDWMLIPRKQFGEDFDYSMIKYNQLDDILKYNAFGRFNISTYKVSIAAGTGGLLYSSDKFKEMTGFDESWGKYGSQDLQIHDQVSIMNEHIDLSTYGICLYKLPYSKLGGRKVISASYNELKSLPNYRFPEHFIHQNNWGTGEINTKLINNV